jgi:acetoin utilization protein AcuB
MKLEEFEKELVTNFMDKNPVTVRPEASIKEVIDLMEKHTVQLIPVVDATGRFVGEIVERDLLKLFIDTSGISEEEIMSEPLLGASFFPEKARDIMRKHERSLSPNDSLGFAAKLMFRHNVTVLPVVEGEKMLGVLSEDSVLKKLRKEVEL